MNLEKYYDWLKLNKTSRNTVSSYFNKVKHFAEWANYKPTQDNLNKYLMNMIDTDKSNNTINLFLNAFRSYCEFAGLNLEIPKSKKVKKKSIVFYFTEDMIKEVCDNLPLMFSDYIFRELLLKFMFYTGVRPSELLNLEKKDVDFENKKINILNAKGQKDRTIPFLNNKLYEDLKKYCQGKEGKVFDISYQQIVYLLKKIQNNLYYGKIIEPRTLRVSFAKYCLISGMNLLIVKKLMGHNDIKTTEIYAEPDEQIIENACKKMRDKK